MYILNVNVHFYTICFIPYLMMRSNYLCVHSFYLKGGIGEGVPRFSGMFTVSADSAFFPQCPGLWVAGCAWGTSPLLFSPASCPVPRSACCLSGLPGGPVSMTTAWTHRGGKVRGNRMNVSQKQTKIMYMFSHR